MTNKLKGVFGFGVQLKAKNFLLMHKQVSYLMTIVAVICCVAVFIDPVQAEDSKCSVRDQSDFTVVVICPEGLDQTGWQEAGAKACGSLMPCAAWIWTDPEVAPKTAPSTPTMFSQEQLTSAVAIWVNEKKQLITIDKVKN